MRRYSNLDPAHRPHSWRTVFRWAVADRVSGRRKIAPPGPPAPSVAPDLATIADLHGPDHLTWIGHASFLGRLGGSSFVVDPNFSNHLGLSFRRHGSPGLTAREIPPLSAILVTHNHYDHLDLPTLRALPTDVPRFVPQGLGAWLTRKGFPRVHEMGWWDAVSWDGLRITFVPARHWSRRYPWDTNRSWWGGWVVEGGGRSVYHAGDTAWFPGFAEIGRRFPNLDAAMLPIGAYDPAWFMEWHHLNPEQAGRAYLETGARVFLPMHWGAFQLTDEPLAEPSARIRAWWEAEGPRDGREMRVLAVGETVSLAAGTTTPGARRTIC